MSGIDRGALFGGAANLLVRVSSFAQSIVFAARFGAGAAADAYLAAFSVPGIFRDLFAEGSMASAFVPTLARTQEEKGLAEAWALVNALLGVLLAALGVLVLLMIALAEPSVLLVAAGFAAVPGKVELTASLVRVAAPFLAAVSLASVASGMLNVRGRFFLPALAPGFMNLAVIVGCLLPDAAYAAIGVSPIVGVASASTVGGFVGFAVQVPALRREGFRFRPHLRGHPGLRRMVVFLAPALVGLATIQVGVLVDQQLASTFGDGPRAMIAWAFRLVNLPMNVLAGPVAIAALPAVSALVARGEAGKARETVADGVLLLTFVVVPCAIALGLFSEPLVALAFERGRFSAEDTAVTAMLLEYYAWGTVGFCLLRLLTPLVYAYGDARTPMVLSVITITVKIPLAWWLTRDGLFGLAGIPLSHAIVVSLEVAMLFVLVGRLAGGWGAGFGLHVARIGAAALVMVLVARGLAPFAHGTAATLGVMAASGGAYVAAAVASGLPHAKRALGRLAGGKRGLPPHVEPTTTRSLEAHHGARVRDVVASGAGFDVVTDRGVLSLRARDGVIVAATETTTPASDPGAAGARLSGVLDVTRRPPPLWGVIIEQEGARWAFRASGDRVVAEEPAGPKLAVA